MWRSGHKCCTSCNLKITESRAAIFIKFRLIVPKYGYNITSWWKTKNCETKKSQRWPSVKRFFLDQKHNLLEKIQINHWWKITVWYKITDNVEVVFLHIPHTFIWQWRKQIILRTMDQMFLLRFQFICLIHSFHRRCSRTPRWNSRPEHWELPTASLQRTNKLLPSALQLLTHAVTYFVWNEASDGRTEASTRHTHTHTHQSFVFTWDVDCHHNIWDYERGKDEGLVWL